MHVFITGGTQLVAPIGSYGTRGRGASIFLAARVLVTRQVIRAARSKLPDACPRKPP